MSTAPTFFVSKPRAPDCVKTVFKFFVLCSQKIIGSLSHLNKLDLSRNQIKGLPENIGNLSNLKHLNLSYNHIATLPTTLGNLKNLKHLDLKSNNLGHKFAEIVGSCQNEAQCQQAAKNVLKAFSSSQSDSDKKKKQQNSGKSTN